jgi:peptide/nickel transport system substrate-binding protein
MIRRRSFVAGLLATPAAPAILSSYSLAQTPRDTIVMAKQIDDIISLDPAESFEYSGNEVTTQLYEKLVTTPNSNPQRITGELAESWTVSDDLLTHTFRIRQGVKFASGAAVTAQDAEYSLRRAVTMNKTPAFILTQFGLNAQTANERIRATDAQTLVIRIAEPVSPSFFHFCLTANVAAVVDRQLVQRNVANNDWGNAWLKTQGSAGSGPYVLRAWRASESVTLEANANYHGAAPKSRRIVIRHIPEPASQLLLLQRGDADMARNLGPDQLRSIQSDSAYRLQQSRKASIMYLGLNQRHEHLGKDGVRQALKWATDYESIQRNIVRTTYDQHQAYLPTGFLGALEDRPYRFDVNRAKEMLARAGYPNGFETTLDHFNAAPNSDIAQAVQANWAQAGVRVRLVAGEQRQVITKMRARQHDVVLARWGADYMDPHTNAEAFSMNPDNGDDARAKTLAWRNAWNIPDLTRRTLEATRERDTERRAQTYLQMQREHQETSPFIIMLQEIEGAAQRANVSGFDMGPTNDRNYYAAITKA